MSDETKSLLGGGGGGGGNGNGAHYAIDVEMDGSKRSALSLSWRDVHLRVTKRSGCLRPVVEEAHILQGITGEAPSGQTLAIMGPSGAGKTSLLNVLAGRTALSSGTVAIIGARANAPLLQAASVYVMQDDVLLPSFSPREVLTFSARLRLPSSMPLEQKQMRVQQLLSRLGLTRCADTPVRGLSGGERKRTSIGVELITDPQMLFLDEPTSGLDSATALAVMTLVTNLAAADGRTVITTIHQPSSEIFGLFQRLMLLALGNVAYDGPADKAISYFSRIGLECPQYTNPADYFIRVLSVNEKPESTEQVNRVTAQYRAIADKEHSASERDQVAPSGSFVLPKQNAASLLEEVGQLTMRSLRNFLREPLTFKVRLIQTVFIAIFVALIYTNLDNNQLSISNRSGAIFFILTGGLFSASMSLVLAFPAERDVFYREQDNHMYHVSTYYFGKVMSEMPFQLLFPLLYTAIVYWTVGLNDSPFEKVIIFYLGILLLNITGQAVGIFFGCALPSAQAAIQVVPMFQTITMIFGGFYIALESLPPWFAWFSYLSPYRYGYAYLMTNEFLGLELRCDPDELRGGICPVESGDVVLANLGYTADSIWQSAAALAGMSLGFHILALLALQFWVWRRRQSTLRE